MFTCWRILVVMAKNSTATQPVTTADETDRDTNTAKNLTRKISEERLHNPQTPHHISKAEMWAIIQRQHAELSQQFQPVELVNFSARVPKATAQAVKTQAAIQGRKVQEVVTEALSEWLETHTEN